MKFISDIINHIAETVMPKVTERMREILQQAAREIREMEKKIKEMPEDEWQQFREKLSVDQMELADRIRERGKEA